MPLNTSDGRAYEQSLIQILIAFLNCNVSLSHGTSRGDSRVPLRSIIYLGLSIYMFFALVTVFCGVFLLLVSITNFIACVFLKEIYDAPPEQRGGAHAASDLVKVDSFWEGLTSWATMIKQQNKVGSTVFILIYIVANLFLFGTTVNLWVIKISKLPGTARPSDWAPWAKGFGALLDLNCAIIVLPVSRTVLRILYNRSTADQGCFSRFLRAILAYIPLDQNITFHKIIAWVILFAACGHISLHFINMAFYWSRRCLRTRSNEGCCFSIEVGPRRALFFELVKGCIIHRTLQQS
jgi:hypothetical protein